MYPILQTVIFEESKEPSHFIEVALSVVYSSCSQRSSCPRRRMKSNRMELTVTVARHHPGAGNTTEKSGRKAVTQISYTPEEGKAKRHTHRGDVLVLYVLWKDPAPHPRKRQSKGPDTEGMCFSGVSLTKAPAPGMQLWLPIKRQTPPEDSVIGHGRTVKATVKGKNTASPKLQSMRA